MRSAAIRDVNFNLGEEDGDGGGGGGGDDGGGGGDEGGSYVTPRARPFVTLTTFLLFGCGRESADRLFTRA